MKAFSAARGPKLFLDETSVLDIGGCFIGDIDVARDARFQMMAIRASTIHWKASSLHAGRIISGIPSRSKVETTARPIRCTARIRHIRPKSYSGMHKAGTRSARRGCR